MTSPSPILSNSKSWRIWFMARHCPSASPSPFPWGVQGSAHRQRKEQASHGKSIFQGMVPPLLPPAWCRGTKEKALSSRSGEEDPS